MPIDVTKPYSVFDLGYGKSLVKEDSFYALEVTHMDSNMAAVNPANLASGETVQQLRMTNEEYQSSNFVTGVSGWRLGPTSAEFIDVTVSGTLVAGEIHIPDVNTTANSFHVNTAGDTWWGTTETNFNSNPENATAYVLKTGVVKFASGVVGGFTLALTSLTDLAGTFGLSSVVTAGDDIRFWAGHVTPASAPFKLTEAGVLTASSGTVGGWTMSATSLTAGVTNIILDASAKAFSINDATFGNDGIQLQYNAGNPRFYAGDGANKYFKFDGSDLSWKGANSELTAAGVFVTTSATIGGWSVGATSFTDAAGVVGISSAVTGGDDIRFWAGDVTPASAEFRVYESGALVASSATITGAITATSGSIGSFTIGTYLYTGSKTAWNDANAGVHIGSDGIGIGNNVFTVNGSTGALVATSATITGSVTATSGRIANWYINTNTISSGAVEASSNVLIDSANSLLRLGPTSGAYLTLDGANQRFRASSYVSGPLGSGFTIEPNFAEFGDIRARGKISTSVFEKDSISAIGGQLVIANADILNADMTAADNSTVTIVGDTTFSVNDILIIGDGVDLEYMRVTNIASAPQYTVTRDLGGAYAANSNPVWKKGTAVTVFGSSDGGSTYSGGWLFLKGAGTNAPYYAVVKRTGVAYNAYTEYARLGNLNGFIDYATDIYGFAVGTTSDYISFDTVNNLRIETSTADAITINHGGNIQLKFGGDIRFTSITAPGACTAALITAAGNIEAGTHSYIITFVNDYGETGFGTASNVVTNDGSNKQNALSNIPISLDGDVTSRRIYRTKAGGSIYYLLTTINNNSATTYTDNIADSTLTNDFPNGRENTTSGRLIWDSASGIFAGLSNTILGLGALHGLTSGYQNTAIGRLALYSLTSGRDNTAVGVVSGSAVTSGNYNALFGSFSGYALTTGSSNVLLGISAGFSLTTQNANVIIGYESGYSTTGAGNVFIGYQAGYNETGNSKLYIENSNSATPLIYGDFSTDYISINGDLEVKTGNDFRLYDADDSNYVGFKAPALAANKIWVLPNADAGNSGQVLGSDASGNLGWKSITDIYGTLSIAKGGTNLTSYAQGDILYASALNTLAALAKNTTATRYLSNTGGSNNPAWAQIDLSNGVTGVLPIANGGTAGNDAATAFANLKQAATTSASGVVELATDAETLVGTDTGRAITPSNLEYARSQNGWIPIAETCTFGAADGPTFTFTLTGDFRTKFYPGMRYKYTQDQAIKSLYHMENNSTDSVSAHNGTDTAITYSAGNAKFGSYGAGFSAASSSKIVISDHADFKPTTPFTVGCWMKTSTGGAEQQLFQSYSLNANAAGWKLFVNSSNAIDFLTGNNTGITQDVNFVEITSGGAYGYNGSKTVTDNAWHMVVATWDGYFVNIYIDGVLYARRYWQTAPAYAANNYVRIGCKNTAGGADASFYTGAIDEVFILHYSLGETNVKALYDADVALASPLTLTKYGIITALPSYSNPNTTITIFGGMDYVMANATIATPFYSTADTPFGFPRQKEKWSVSNIEYVETSQINPVQNTWYNLGGKGITCPIGAWDIFYRSLVVVTDNAQLRHGYFMTLSNANNTEWESLWTTSAQDTIQANDQAGCTLFNQRQVTFNVKTTLYLNSKVNTSSATGLYNESQLDKSEVCAICAYL